MSPFFFWILPCLDPMGHKRKCSQKHIKRNRETEKERKGNREMGSAGLKLWTPHCDGLHNWPQFSPLPVLYPPLFQFPLLPWGEGMYFGQWGMNIHHPTGAVNAFFHVSPHHHHHPSWLPSLNLLMCEQVQQRWAELGQPPTHCELNKCLLSHVTEICLVVSYYTEMADQDAGHMCQEVAPLSSIPNIC